MENKTQININQLFEDALKDPNLFSTIDIDNLLSKIETDKHDYLENKTTASITDEIYTLLSEQVPPIENKKEICKKLVGYRYVDEINELHKGKHVRWIRNNGETLTNGGIVVDIKFLDNGIHVMCKNSMNRFIQYKFDDCNTFQKLTTDEQFILMAYEYTQNN
jgi:hypothetical protein